MAGKINVQEMLDLKAASYKMAVLNDSGIDQVLKNTAKADVLKDSMDALASQMMLAVQMQAYSSFIDDADRKKIVSKQCEGALSRAIEVMAQAMS